MKKVLSLTMALVMMMAVMVPAFAEDAKIDKTTPQTGEAIVQTTYVDGDATYSVTYSATMDIKWGDTSTEFKYTVNSQLKPNQAINVKIGDLNSDGYNLVSSTNKTIAYSVNGAVDGTTSAPVTTEEFKYTIDVTEENWKAAAIDTYADTITFTVAVVGA